VAEILVHGAVQGFLVWDEPRKAGGGAGAGSHELALIPSEDFKGEKNQEHKKARDQNDGWRAKPLDRAWGIRGEKEREKNQNKTSETEKEKPERADNPKGREMTNVKMQSRGSQ